MTHTERLLGALYASEGWYATWQNYMARGVSRPGLRARAVVVFDRVLNVKELLWTQN